MKWFSMTIDPALLTIAVHFFFPPLITFESILNVSDGNYIGPLMALSPHSSLLFKASRTDQRF